MSLDESTAPHDDVRPPILKRTGSAQLVGLRAIVKDLSYDSNGYEANFGMGNRLSMDAAQLWDNSKPRRPPS
jgi:hypothetical protein